MHASEWEEALTMIAALSAACAIHFVVRTVFPGVRLSGRRFAAYSGVMFLGALLTGWILPLGPIPGRMASAALLYGLIFAFVSYDPGEVKKEGDARIARDDLPIDWAPEERQRYLRAAILPRLWAFGIMTALSATVFIVLAIQIRRFGNPASLLAAVICGSGLALIAHTVWRGHRIGLLTWLGDHGTKPWSCRGCNYDLRSVDEWRCPECGRVIEQTIKHAAAQASAEMDD